MLKRKSLKSGAVGALALLVLAAPAANADYESYIGSVKIFGFNFCPRDWLPADGRLLPIPSNTALFSLYSMLYGGDGRTSFGIPDYRGRVITGAVTNGSNPPYRMATKAGRETVTLTTATMGTHLHTGGDHTHDMIAHGHNATLSASSNGPSVQVPSDSASLATWPGSVYATGQANGVALSSQSVQILDSVSDPTLANSGNKTGYTGQGAAMNMRSPYLALTHCVRVDGPYPPRN